MLNADVPSCQLESSKASCPPGRDRRGRLVCASVITPRLSHSDQRDVIPPCPRGEQRHNIARQSHPTHCNNYSSLDPQGSTPILRQSFPFDIPYGYGGATLRIVPTLLHVLTLFVSRSKQPLEAESPIGIDSLSALLGLVNSTPRNELVAARAATNSRNLEILQTPTEALSTDGAARTTAEGTQRQQGERARFRNHR